MIAELLELSGDEDRFRPISYRRAARAIESEAEDVGALAREGRLTQIPGVGKGIAAKIEEFLRPGKIGELEALRAQFPPGLLEIMRIPDIGPKTARRLHLELGVNSLEDLRTVALQGRLRALKGFGEKSEQNVLKGIGLVESAKGQNLLGIVLPIAEQIVEYVRTHASVDHVAYGGSVRRMKESVGDCDILVTTTDPAAATKAFLSFPMVREVVMSGDTKSTVVVSIGGERLQVDLRVLEPRSWGSGLQYFTGSKDHNIKVRTMAAKVGLKLNEYGVFRGDERAAGEIEAALSGALPDLVTMGDIRGDLHAHTNLTDGVNTVEEMAAAAAARGYEYLGISDHSPSLRVANGLSEEHLRIHVAHIREFNRQTAGIRLLAGTECDILADGTLDYPDPVLKDLDYVIGSVHSNFKMPEKEMMARVLRAMENEHMDILAHPTTRKIGQREPIQLNMERLPKAAPGPGGGRGVNSHTTEQLWFMRLAVGSARRGWLGKEDVVNTMPHKEILRFLA